MNLIETRVYLNIHYAREKDNTHTHTPAEAGCVATRLKTILNVNVYF